MVEAVVEKKEEVVPKFAMKLLRLTFCRVEEPVTAKLVDVPVVKMTPDPVFTEKIDDEAAFNTLKARPFAGEVWIVVVPWP